MKYPPKLVFWFLPKVSICVGFFLRKVMNRNVFYDFTKTALEGYQPSSYLVLRLSNKQLSSSRVINQTAIDQSDCDIL